MDHGGEFWQNLVHRRRQWQNTSVLLPWESHEHYQLVNSVTQLCLTLCNPMDCPTPGFPVHYQLLELAQTHVHQVSDAIQSSHPLSSPSPPAFNLGQHQGLFQWVSSPHQVDKILEFQLLHQMNTMKRQKDMTLKNELAMSVGTQYATRQEWGNNTRKNEETEPKQKQCLVVDETCDGSKV